MGKRILDILSAAAIIVILTVAAFFSITQEIIDIVPDATQTGDKATLMRYSYIVLDDYFGIENNDTVDFDEFYKNFDFGYHKLFLTIICNGSIRGCMSGSVPIDVKNRVFLDVEEAVVECIEDSRFGGVLLEEEAFDAEIVFTFLYDKQKLESNYIDHLEENIELGIHAIEIERDGKSSYFKESVPISHNYKLEYTLERLCKKAGLDDDAWQDFKTSIYKYETISFIGDRQGDIIDLYRYNILVDVDDLSTEKIFESVSLGQSWFFNNIDPETNLLEYKYYPSSDKYSTSNNHVRQIACLWAITELELFFKTNMFDEMIETTFDYYLGFKNTSENFAFLMIDDYAKLAYNAFIILALVNYPDYPNRDSLLVEFAEGILSQQNDDGSYDTYFISDKNSGVDFYPGEAMLSLMKLYKETGEEKYKESVEKAFPYYRSYWRNDSNTAFVPWHTQTYWILYQENEDDELVEFVFEMNDWIIDNYQIKDDIYIDKIGGFSKNDRMPSSSTSSYMEGINDAYSMAVLVDNPEHIEKYKNSIKLGARCILQMQYNENNSFYLENPAKAIGGFKQSLTDNDQRIDYTQHAVFALMKVYKNNVFS